MSTLESQAAELGIPMKVTLGTAQYSYCSAHIATLASIEGKHALYKGVCANRHVYHVKRLVSELQAERKNSMQIGPGGKLIYGQDEGFQAGPLEEF